MCGIYGSTGQNKESVLKMMSNGLHRGPDGSGIFCNKHVTLGHSLLSITEAPSRSRQPWKTPLGNILIFNGEIFNEEELRGDISKYGGKLRTKCDTEILAWLLDCFGVNKTNRRFIDSQHAYAYYNINKNTLTLSRDHAGIKPLYYIFKKDELFFSSEISDILLLFPEENTIHDLSFASFLYTGHHCTRDTVFHSIKKLAPGETVTIDLDSKKIINKFVDLVEPSSLLSFDVEEFRSNLRHSVLSSTSVNRKKALLLSGGLDSSSIASHVNQDVNIYSTLCIPSPQFRDKKTGLVEKLNEDRDIALEYSNSRSLNHYSIIVRPSDIANCINDAAKVIEEPSFNGSHALYYYTFKALKRDGIIVAFTGDFGDELLAGYPKYYAVKVNQDALRDKKTLLWHWFLQGSSMQTIPKGFPLKYSKRDIFEYLFENLPDELFDEADPLNSWMALDCYTRAGGYLRRNDKYGMKFGIEGRFPMTSKRFMKYALSINSDFKIGSDSLQTKLLIKKAYNGVLPEYILNKPKTGWSGPLEAWFQSSAELRSKYHRTFKETSSEWKTLLDINPPGTKRGSALWMLKLWLTSFDIYLDKID